jgi:hypothetical protein
MQGNLLHVERCCALHKPSGHGVFAKNSHVPVGRRAIKITPHISHIWEHFQVVLNVPNGGAILIQVHIHQMQGAKIALNSDNHDIAMVHNVRAKLRLNCAINISKNMQSVFVQVKPFRI